MDRFYDNRWDEADWQNESAAVEKDEIAREARDLADWHTASDSPAITAFLDQTTPDAPAGRYVMEGESELDRTTGRVPIAEPHYCGLAISLIKEAA